MSTCYICGRSGGKIKSFFIGGFFHCAECGKETCHSYCGRYYGGYLFCLRCCKKIIESTREIIVVKGPYIGRHKIIEKGDEISSGYYRDYDTAVDELKYKAYKKGFGGITELTIDRATESEPSDSGKGIHYYKVFRASGVLVKVVSK